MTSTFLFRAVLGSLGLLFMVRLSVLVRITLFSKAGSTKGWMSSGVPQRAEPYSMFLRNFRAFLPFTWTMRRTRAANAIPTIRSTRTKLGKGD